MINGFKSVIAIDFEFSAPNGERPLVVCLVAKDLVSGKTWRIFQDDLNQMRKPPYPANSETLIVAYYASAEMNCYLSLNWAFPEYLLDLFTEFRCLTNGKKLSAGGASLLGALSYFGLSGIEALEKEGMRELAMRGGQYSKKEQSALLNYCESDVLAVERLILAMLPFIDLPRAYYRGRYMKTAALMEYNGIPVDTNALSQLRDKWDEIQYKLIAQIDKEFQVYEDKTFKTQRFADYLIRNHMSWPTLPTGNLDLSDDTFKDMCKTYPQLSPLRELRVTLSRMRLSTLAVGRDGRNRCLISAFRAKTGRNQPSNAQFIFGPSTWLRSLIKPKQGVGVAYIDWSQQEFGIAAALSGDELMKEAYASGDPYLAFAKQAGTVPLDATKESHPKQREQFKACVLAVQYGMGAESLAARIDLPVIKARELLCLHRQTYRKFWEWSDAALDYAMLNGKLWTVFGWAIHLDETPNPRSLANFPMQANGAEMLRLACILMAEQNIKICAPIHDAVLIEAPLEELDNSIAIAKECMKKASQIILGGFELATDEEVIRYPERYVDKRGKAMWEAVWQTICELSSSTRSVIKREI
jgi:DNA polymerase family A